MPPKEHLIKCLGAEFVTSFAKWNPKNIEPLPQICVVGRSNVGKSSVINALVERHGLAKTSSTPGRTQLINLFSAKFRRGDDERAFHLVDLPGYGYAKVPLEMKASWLPMMQSYFDLNARIFAIVFLVDLRRTPGPEDLEFCQMAGEKNLPMLPVATKIDKIPKTQRVRELKKISDALGLEHYRDVHAVSVTERIGVDALRADLGAMLLPPLPE